MSHDFHFLSRTVDVTRNLPQPAVERAMLLYNDPALLRFIFEQALLPEGLEDVAIALTHDERSPHLVVHRSGHFRTILGASMPVTRALVLTRKQFDGQIERMGALRERLAAAEKLSGERGGAAKLIARLMKAGTYLSREEFIAISHWQPLLRDYFVALFGEVARQLELRRLAIRRHPTKRLEQLGESQLRQYWEGYCLLGHLALLSVMDRHRHARPLAIEPARLFDYFPGRLFRLGTIGAALKAGWVAGELGKDILGAAKRIYATPGGHWEILEGATALLGIAARRPKTYAEIAKIIDTPLRGAAAAEQADVERLVEWIRGIFRALETPDPAEVALWEQFATEAFRQLEQLPTSGAVPVELGPAAAAHSQQSVKDIDGLGLLFLALPRAAAVEPKLLYLPEAALSTVRGQWQPSDALSLLAMQESFLEKPQPARAVRTPGRNDPCPCGSGKKYKRCHGSGSDSPAA
jgi:hypothetical protein